jgi:hypothetical protein
MVLMIGGPPIAIGAALLVIGDETSTTKLRLIIRPGSVAAGRASGSSAWAW